MSGRKTRPMFSARERERIRKKHKGFLKEVAESLGYSRDYVANVFNGHETSKPVSEAIQAELDRREKAPVNGGGSGE